MQKIVYLSLKDIVTGNALVLPTPTNVTWAQGIEEQIIQQTTDFGDLYTADSVVTGRDPAVTPTYGSLTKELLALKTGFKLETQADTGIYLKTIEVRTASYAAVAIGRDGNGMIADQATTTASVLRNGISVPLTRQPFATFAGATVDSFAQGADGALKFSDDIVAARGWVTIYATYPIAAGDVLSETLFDTFTCSMVGILHDKSVFNLVFDPVVTNRADNGDIDFGADSYDFPLRITDSACVPRLKFLNRTRQC